MTIELSDRDECARWFAAGACLMRLSSPASESAMTSLVRRAAVALEESAMLPPPGVLADVARLFEGARPDSRSIPSLELAPLETQIRLYEDRFLARLAEDRYIVRIIDALAPLSAESKERASAIVASRMIARMELARKSAVAMSAAIVRRQLEVSPSELVELGRAALRGPGRIADLLVEGYAGIVRGARRQSALLVEADAFLVEHLSALDRLSQRVAIEQMIEAGEHLQGALPKRMKPRRSDARGLAATRLEDQDQYPVGGFSSMSTSGALENLVTSELIYMEDALEPGMVDLFDLRYVESELLYYTRDESAFLRRRYSITFLLEPGLERARFKDAGVAWQRIVLAFGLVACAVRRLSEWLREEELSFRIVFARRPGARTPTLAAEMDLIRILLDEAIAKDLVEIKEAESVPGAIEEARAIGSELITIRMSDGSSTAQKAGGEDSEGLVLDLGQPLPELLSNAREASSGALDRRFSELLDAWGSVARELLQHLVDRSGRAA